MHVGAPALQCIAHGGPVRAQQIGHARLAQLVQQQRFGLGLGHARHGLLGIVGAAIGIERGRKGPGRAAQRRVFELLPQRFARAEPGAHVFARHGLQGGDALAALYPQLDSEIYRYCNQRVFNECQNELPSGEPRQLDPIESKVSAS